MAAVMKRSRKQKQRKHRAVDYANTWKMVTAVYDENTGVLQLANSVPRDNVVKSLTQIFNLAQDDLPPLLDITTKMIDDKQGIQQLVVTKDQCAIIQTLGFAFAFEMNGASLKKGLDFLTVPLAPVLERLFLMQTSVPVVDKWQIYSASYILTSWFSRRFFDVDVDISKTMLTQTHPALFEHYTRLPKIVEVLKDHAKISNQTFTDFFTKGVVGISAIYTFLALGKVDRIHHRLIDEVQHTCMEKGVEFMIPHCEFVEAVNRLVTYVQQCDGPSQTFIVFTDDIIRDWDIDIQSFCVGAYKFVCDPEVEPCTGVAIMLSMGVSALDNGECVAYMETIASYYKWHARYTQLLDEMMFGRSPEDRPSVEEKLMHDLETTDIFDSRIFFDLATIYQDKIRLVHKHRGRLGLHTIQKAHTYMASSLEVGENGTLFGASFQPRVYSHPLQSFEIFLALLDDYYMNKKSKDTLPMDLYPMVASTKHLLPVYTGGIFFDRVFFHL
jgi:hypothetical protein